MSFRRPSVAGLLTPVAPRVPLADASDRANSAPNDKKQVETIDLTKPSTTAPKFSHPDSLGNIHARQDKPTVRAYSGTKRKASSNDEPLEDSQIDLSHINTELLPCTDNADQVRRKIRRLIDNGGMKVGVFCDTIGVSNVAYNRFLKQSGPTKGIQSAVFSGAWDYFTKREIAGIKLPTKASSAAVYGTKKAKTAAGEGAGSARVDISGIHLEDEEFDEVPIYDTCDDVRKKIDFHLRRPGVTRAQFCRDLHAQLHSGVGVQSKQLSDFRGKKGGDAGAASSVFYAAYVFFEKVRIAEGKPKTKKREDMEKVWPGGFERRDSSRGVWIGPGGSVYTDEYGRVSSA